MCMNTSTAVISLMELYILFNSVNLKVYKLYVLILKCSTAVSDNWKVNRLSVHKQTHKIP